jgi:tetratricopeptide (TPR) repeat protein
MRILAILLSMGIGLAAAGKNEVGSDAVPSGSPSIEPLDIDSGKIGSMVDYLMALQEKDDGHAAELLLNVLKYDPDAEMPLLLLLKKSSAPETLKKVEPRLVELARANPRALKLNLAVLLFTRNNLPPGELADMGQAAVGTVEDPAALSPQNRTVLAKLAEITIDMMGREKRYTDAEKIIERLIRVGEFRNDMQFLQAVARFYAVALESSDLDETRRGQYRLQQEQLLQLAEKDFGAPAELPGVLQTVELYRLLGAYRQAIKLINYQLLKMPNNQVLQERLGDFLFISGDTAGALQVRRDLARRFPEIQNYQNAYAETLLRSGDIQSAIVELEAISKKHPRDPYFRYMLGLAYYYGQHYREAVEYLKNFDHYSALQMLVSSYTNLGEYSEALGLLAKAEQAKNFKPTSGFYFMYLGIAEKSRNPELVRKYADLIREKFGVESAENANAVGYTYADLGIELEDAEKLIRHALALDPGNMAILDSMAWVLYRRGDLKGARYYIEKSIEAAGDALDPTVADHAGDIYNSLRYYDRAVRFWKKALRLNGEPVDSTEIQQKIKAAEDELAFE